jgi:hypothetical protein
VFVAPSVIALLPGVEEVGAGALATVKHSSLVPSVEAV